MSPLLPRRRVPIWVNWKRRRLLTSFRDDLERYFECLEYEAFPFQARETDEARELRAELEGVLGQVVRVVRVSGGPSLHRQAPGEAEGSVVRIDVLEAVFELERYNVPPEEVLGILEEAREAYEADRHRAWLRTLNPLYWTDRLMSWVEGLPFYFLARAGVSPSRAARSLPGRALRTGLRLGVLGLVVGGLLWAVGWHDDVASFVARSVERLGALVGGPGGEP